MKIKVNIFYPQLLNMISKKGDLYVNGSTIIECLEDLVRQFPPAKTLLFDERGCMVRNVFVYINEESRYPPGLDAPLEKGDILLIASLVTGG